MAKVIKRKSKKEPKWWTIYLKISDHEEQVELNETMTDDEIVGLFVTAAEVSPRHILKLYSEKTPRQQYRIGSTLPPNTPTTRYTLEIACAGLRAETTIERLGFDAWKLEERINNVEALLRVMTSGAKYDSDSNAIGKVDIVSDLKLQNGRLIDKIITRKSLGWLGFRRPKWYGSTLVNEKNELDFVVAYNAACPPQTEHELRTSDTIARFRQLDDVYVSHSVIENLRSTKFNNWEWNDHELLVLMREMYRDLGLDVSFSIEIARLNEWLIRVFYMYNEVPFHCFKHCFMVTQMTYSMIWLLDIRQICGEIDLLILLTSAICHDLGHTGLNNTFHIDARTMLGIRYNDIAPLESHHSSLASQIMLDPNINPFRYMTPEDFTQLRSRMIYCILATEMRRHKEFVDNFLATAPFFDIEESTHKDLLLSIFIKVADVSNEVRPLEVSMAWIDSLCTEFLGQYDREVALGIPTTPFMNTRRVSKASSQIGFIKFVLLPLFGALRLLFPEVDRHLISPINRSLKYWLAIEKMDVDPEMKGERLEVLMAELLSFDITSNDIDLSRRASLSHRSSLQHRSSFVQRRSFAQRHSPTVGLQRHSPK